MRALSSIIRPLVRPALLACCALALPLMASAAVQLPNLFSDHAVLQRDRPVRVWGWAQAAEHVTVRLHGQTVATQADPFGYWEAWLKPEAAGGPFTLTITGDATPAPIERKDILMGDVWLASGQSNMEFPLLGFPGGTNPAPLKDGEKEIAAANHPRIRLLVQKKATSAVPLSEGSDTWTECTPETAAHFSAVSYFFGRTLSDRENVPVGLIDTTWGWHAGARMDQPAGRWGTPTCNRCLPTAVPSPMSRGAPTQSRPTMRAKMRLCRRKASRPRPIRDCPTIMAAPGLLALCSTP